MTDTLARYEVPAEGYASVADAVADWNSISPEHRTPDRLHKMLGAVRYRFRCQIETEDGDVLIADYCPLGRIDEFGQSEMVDIHVGALLRAFNRTVRAEHERANTPEED